jgi:hypothetical protein
LLSLARAHPKVSLVVVLAVAGVAWGAFVLFEPGQRGRISRTIADARDALVRGDAEAAMSYVSPHFSEDRIDRDRLAELLEGALADAPISRAVFVIRELQVRGGRASARVQVRSVHTTQYRPGVATSDWVIQLEKIGERWLLRSAEPLSVNDRRVAGLRAVLALGR